VAAAEDYDISNKRRIHNSMFETHWNSNVATLSTAITSILLTNKYETSEG
jgi:hypothetical protein